MISPSHATFGDRVKYARISTNLSQREFAKAIANLTNSKTSKSSISQWETDKIANPHNSAILAITAVTGFAQKWLVNGTGPQRAPLPSLMIAGKNNETRSLLRRAITIACAVHKEPELIADASIEIFETLSDEPNAPDGALKRIARLITAKK